MKVEKLSIQDLAKVADDASDVLDQVYAMMASPNPAKIAPTFNSPYIADLCKIDKTQMPHLAKKHNLPLGEKIAGAKARSYTLAEVIEWAMTVGRFPRRPNGKRGKVIVSCNYKGGVAKTTTAVALAQALTLRGLKVCIGDLDPQSTATQLMGIKNTGEHVKIEQTIMPLVYGDEPNLSYAVQSSYWHNLSIIPGGSYILGAEFAIPGRAIKERGFPFWNILTTGIDPLRDEFDVIILDTSPSLSHVTMNAMLAGDGLIMPCPPEALDFASSVQFWGLFSELAEAFPEVGNTKVFDFMTIIYTKAKSTDAARLVKTWMEQAYGQHVNGIEIPESSAASLATAQFKTVYDLSKPDGTLEAYRRYKDPQDRLADYVLDKLALSWSQE